MISDKQFTLQEFNEKMPEFAQAFINKIKPVSPDTTLRLRGEAPGSYLITLETGHKSEYYNLRLENGHVVTESVYMV